jgi:hypothetical protein
MFLALKIKNAPRQLHRRGPLRSLGRVAERTPEKLRAITPLVHERVRLLRDVGAVADFFFTEPQSYDPAELIPQKGDAALAAQALHKSKEVADAAAPSDRGDRRNYRVDDAIVVGNAGGSLLSGWPGIVGLSWVLCQGCPRSACYLAV